MCVCVIELLYVYIYIYIYICIYMKFVTVVVGYPKALFSIATTPRCKGGLYFFP